MSRRLLFAMVGVCLFVSTAHAADAKRTAAEHLADGNKLLAARQYDEALAAYDMAAEALPRSAEVAYNRGIALYRLDRFAEAQTAFQDVLTRGRPALEAAAKFNLGRSAQAAAMSKADDLKAAVNDLGRSIGFYKDTLQLKPDHAAAKKNMADAERMRGFLKKIIELMPKEEEQKKKDGDKKDKDDADSQPSEDGEKQDSAQEDGEDDKQQSDSQQGDESDSQEDEGEQSDEQREPSTQPATQPSEEPKTQPASQPATAPTSQPFRPQTTQPSEQDIERQEAERMLQEARDAERKRRAEKRRRRMSRQGRIPVDKDW